MVGSRLPGGRLLASPASAHEERPASFPDGTSRWPAFLGLDNPRHRVVCTPDRARKRFTIPAGGATTVRLSVFMHGCVTLSARVGSFATAVALRTERVGMLDDVATVARPEKAHTGSPREAFCPNATATSRPPG